MSYQTINNTEIETGKPVDQALFTKVKNNFDDHELRIAAFDGLTSRMTTAENNITALQNKTNTTFAGLTSSGGLTAVNLLNNTINYSNQQ